MIEYPEPSTTIFLAMRNSIIFIFALSVVAMMLASCESFNPFTPPNDDNIGASGWPVTDQTNRTPYEVPLGRGSENYIHTDY